MRSPQIFLGTPLRLPQNMDDGMRPELRVEDLSLTIEGKTILSHIDFSAREPRLGIVGRNGSGKTSLARSIAGLITPSSADVA